MGFDDETWKVIEILALPYIVSIGLLVTGLMLAPKIKAFIHQPQLFKEAVVLADTNRDYYTSLAEQRQMYLEMGEPYVEGQAISRNDFSMSQLEQYVDAHAFDVQEGAALKNY